MFLDNDFQRYSVKIIQRFVVVCKYIVNDIRSVTRFKKRTSFFRNRPDKEFYTGVVKSRRVPDLSVKSDTNDTHKFIIGLH